MKVPHPDAPLTPVTLMLAPELAVLALLDEIVPIATYALHAAHPQLGDLNPLEPYPPDTKAARRLINCLHRCRWANSRYRHAALEKIPDQSDDNDIPF